MPGRDSSWLSADHVPRPWLEGHGPYLAQSGPVTTSVAKRECRVPFLSPTSCNPVLWGKEDIRKQRGEADMYSKQWCSLLAEQASRGSVSTVLVSQHNSSLGIDGFYFTYLTAIGVHDSSNYHSYFYQPFLEEQVCPQANSNFIIQINSKNATNITTFDWMT